MKIFKRGDVYMCKLNSTGHVQNGLRPCIIISNNTGNLYSKILIVVPLTTNIYKKYQPTHFRFTMNSAINIALCENVLTIDKSQCCQYIATLNNSILTEIEKCLKIAIGIE